MYKSIQLNFSIVILPGIVYTEHTADKMVEIKS